MRFGGPDLLLIVVLHFAYTYNIYIHTLNAYKSITINFRKHKYTSITMCIYEFRKTIGKEYWRIDGGQRRKRLHNSVCFNFRSEFKQRNMFSIVTALKQTYKLYIVFHMTNTKDNL